MGQCSANNTVERDVYVNDMETLDDASQGNRLLFISTQLPLFEVLIQAAKPDVLVVPVLFYQWTLDELINAIVERAGQPKHQYSSVGFLDHGTQGKFCLLKSISNSDDGHLGLSDVQDSKPLQEFFQNVARYVKPPSVPGNWREDIGCRIDLMACNVAGSSEGELLIKYLENLTQVNWAASATKVGFSKSKSANWIMETEKELGLGSIREHYFKDEEIKQWKHTCFGISLGPISIDTNKGVDVKPQMKFGVETEHFSVGGGFGDIRDGLEFGAGASIKQGFTSRGKTIDELINNVEAKTDIREIKDALTQMLKATIERNTKMLNWLADICGFNFVKKMKAGSLSMTLDGTASTGVGVSGKAAGGWEDSQGYHMMGVAGSVAAGLKSSVDFFAGKHKHDNKVKILAGVSHFSCQVIASW